MIFKDLRDGDFYGILKFSPIGSLDKGIFVEIWEFGFSKNFAMGDMQKPRRQDFGLFKFSLPLS